MTRVELWEIRISHMKSYWSNFVDWYNDNIADDEKGRAELINYLRTEWGATLISDTDNLIGLVSHLEFDSEEEATAFVLRWA